MIKPLPRKLSQIIISFLAFLIACSPVTSQVVAPTKAFNLSPTAVYIPTSTSLPTPSQNILELNSASKLALPQYKRECINLLRPNKAEFKKSIQGLSVEGVAVFSDYINEKDAIVLLDLKSGEKHVLPEDVSSDKWVSQPKVSPDGKWLFYLTARENDLMGAANFVLSNSNGDSIKTIPVSIVKNNGYSYQFVHDWLSNDSLRLLSKKDYEDNNLIVLLYNPFTEQITRLQNDFDGLQSPVITYGKNANNSPNDQYLDWGIDPFFEIVGAQLNGANVAYSPDKNLAFYPHKDGYDVLYDLQSQKELVRLLIPNWGDLPRWSRNGENISIIATPPNFSQESAKKDFYLLSKDGKNLKRLTYLSEQFDRVSIKEYSWSPDGTKIAFWLNTNFPLSENEAVTYELAMVDIATGNITNLCVANPNVTVKQLAENAGFLDEPVWSQNNNDLLVEIPSVEKSYPDFYTEIVLVVPSKLSALAMMKDAELKGWMLNEP